MVNKVSKTSALTRRDICKLGLASGITLPLSALAQPPARMRPQPGDALVFEEGPHADSVVAPELLEFDQRPVSALARDPETNTLRNGSRLNRVMVTKLRSEDIESRYQRYSAAGVVAYSIVCTHTGCDVTNWDDDQLRMACPCHESQFDVYAGGKVVGGPAPRPLAMLPLVIVSDQIQVAAGFAGRVGFTQQF